MYFDHRLKQKLNAHDEVIKSNDEKILFVKETKILGVIIDEDLIFKSQISYTCNKANSKTDQLIKSLYLFTDNFKASLFKIFIFPNFDYCSTLTQHLTNKAIKEKLNSCFAQSLNKIVQCDIENLTLEQQYKKLTKYGILPLEYRLFFRYCTFIYNIINNRKLELSKQLIKNEKLTRSIYIIPKYKKDFFKFSFITISSKILNLFLTDTIRKGKNNIETIKDDLKLKIIDLYKKSYWYWNNY